MLTRGRRGSGLALVGLMAALVLSLLPYRQAASDHASSDDWEGSFDSSADSEYVQFPYDSDLYKRWRCNLDGGCVWLGNPTVFPKGETYVNPCLLKSAYHDETGDCWNTAPGKDAGDDGGGSEDTNCWLLGNCIMGQGPQGFGLEGSHAVTFYSETAAADPPTAVWVVLHDPTHYGFRFCTSSGWGRGSQWGTRHGPIDGYGHRLQWVGGTASPVVEAPFCGTWRATAPDPDPSPDPDPVECLRDGFVYFEEYGGCRLEDCSTLSYGYVRDPHSGWCVPAPPPPGVPDVCVAHFEVLFPHLANLITYDEPAERRRHCNRRRLNYPPVWMTRHDGDPQREGATQTVSHRLLHITGVSPVQHPPFGGFDWNPDNRCDGADELNVHPAVPYDCVQVAVSVRAGFTAADHGAWRFNSKGCANPVGWRKNPDRSCDSADGTWSRSYGSDPQPADDPGDWTVTVGELERAGSSDHLVAVPFEVDVTDWGDADYLAVTATARDYWDTRAGASSNDTITFEVHRRTGQPPTADTVEVNVAEVSALRYRRGVRDERFVEVLRSTLLANDACPAGVDCADPAQWPVTIPDPRAQRCSSKAFGLRWSWRMLHTDQGLVGCDKLNDAGDPDDPAGVRYWPRMWAAGRDRFVYATPGGTAAVTVRFTDTPPEAHDVTVRDPGESFAAVRYDYDRRRRCGAGWGAYPCATPDGTVTTGWMLTYERDDATSFRTPNRYHTGTADLAADDADGDFSALWIIDAADMGGEQLRGGVKLGSRRVDLYPTGGDAAARAPGQALDAADDRWRSIAAYGNRCLTKPTERWHTPHNSVHPGVWAWDGASQGTCKPSSRCPSTLAATRLCWSSWGRDDGADTAVAVDYRACDARYDAVRSDRSAFGAYLASVIAGRWPHLTEYQVATAVSRHVGGSYRPSPIDAEDWKSITSAVDDHIDARHCSRAAVTLQFGDCFSDMSDTQRSLLADEVAWHTFIDLDPAGEPGAAWPPHPEMPGSRGHLVVADSPVWPRIDDPAALDFTDDGGCAWTADWVQTRAAQMLPWNAAHRAQAEADADSRFEAWLRMWDSLSVRDQTEAERSHTDLDFESVRCPVAAAADSAEPFEHNSSYLQCRWTVPRPGVWHWQMLAELSDEDRSRNVQAVLADGLSWFRSFHAYTAQRTFIRSGPGQD